MRIDWNINAVLASIFCKLLLLCVDCDNRRRLEQYHLSFLDRTFYWKLKVSS